MVILLPAAAVEVVVACAQHAVGDVHGLAGRGLDRRSAAAPHRGHAERVQAVPCACRCWHAPTGCALHGVGPGGFRYRASLWLGVTVNLVTGRRKGRNSYGTGEVSLRNARRYGRPAPSGVLPFSGVALCHRWDHLTHQPLPAS